MLGTQLKGAPFAFIAGTNARRKMSGVAACVTRIIYALKRNYVSNSLDKRATGQPLKICEQRQLAITLKPPRLKWNKPVQKFLPNEAEAGMLGDPKTNEWSLLKDQFDALVHDESMREDSIERFCDDQIRRRFAEWINRAAERKSLNRAC